MDTPVRILVVDDDGPLRWSLAKALERAEYHVTGAESAERAIELLETESFAVALFDVGLPGMHGLDLIPEALARDQHLSIVMLTGVADPTAATVAMHRGAFDYLVKPVDVPELHLAVSRARQRRETQERKQELFQWATGEATIKAAELEASRAREAQLAVACLQALIGALEAKNAHLGGHSSRVAAFATSVAVQLGLSDETVDQVRTAGRLHDLGMIGVREAVLDKQGPLNDEEYRHVQEHTRIGARILAPLTHLGPVIQWVRSHHERWDGSGYPDRLAGAAIPQEARILHAAEVYDALTTNRAYQDVMDAPAAAARMRELGGSVLDAEVVEALEAVVADRGLREFLPDQSQAPPA